MSSVQISPDSLSFGPDSQSSEGVTFQIVGTLPTNSSSESTLSIRIQRNSEELISRDQISVARDQDRLIATVTVPVDTRSNAPIEFISALEYSNGETGDIFRHSIPVRSNLGSPPVVDSVKFPSEIIKPTAGSTPVLFVAHVSDADGLDNIDVVTMSIFDSEQNLVGSPLRLYDDGGQTDLGNGVRSGDETANDGAFTRTLQIDNTNTARTLTLLFQATDRSGQSSNSIEQPFTISDP